MISSYTDFSTVSNNPEIDQLLARFDHNRGRLGLLFFRSSSKPASVISRCKDAAKPGLGIILPIDDEFVFSSLELIVKGDRKLLDKKVNDLYQKIIS